MAGLLLIHMSQPVRLLGVCYVVVGGILLYRRVRASGVRRAGLSAERGWWLEEGHADSVGWSATSAFVSRPLVVVYLRRGRHRKTLLIPSDAVTPEVHRRLRALLSNGYAFGEQAPL